MEANLQESQVLLSTLRVILVSHLIDQGLFSVRALVFDLAQLTSQKRFDGGYEIIEPSSTFLGTSYGQIVVAVFTQDEIFTRTQRSFYNRQKSEENAPGAPVLVFF